MTNKERDILIKHLENIILRAETAAEQQAPEMKYPYIAGALKFSK